MDIRIPKFLYAKAILLLTCSVLACIAIVVEQPAIRTVLLLAIALWSFARAYYFAFYVLEHYVDGRFRYSGVFSMIRYLVSR